MAAPTLIKTWQFQSNRVFAAQSTNILCSQSTVLGLKNMLLAFALKPWQVWGSCNGAGMFGNGDGVDRWISPTDLVWNNAGSGHSWIVLTQPEVSAKYALLLDLSPSDASGGVITLRLSLAAGFGAANGGSNGTATAAPVASDAITLINGASWGGGSSFELKRHVLHAMMSSDGKNTRLLVCRDGLLSGLWLLETAIEHIAAWSVPHLAYAIGQGSFQTPTEVQQQANLTNLQLGTAGFYSRLGATLIEMTLAGPSTNMTYPYTGHQMLVSLAGKSQFLVAPARYAYSRTSGYDGVKGKVPDLWWANASGARATRLYFPGDASRTFAMIGDLLLPWDGSDMQLE